LWVDSETAIDYINFSSVAESVVELIEQAKGRPLSIGISGAWGVGKSSLMLLTRDALEAREKQAALESGVAEKDFKSKYIFVRFDAWLYQGYDDARAALMDSIASQLLAAAKGNETATDKAKAFLARVRFRVARLTVGSAVAMSLGIPPVGLFGEGVALVKGAVKDGPGKETIESAEGLVDEAAEAAAGLVRPKTDAAVTPRQQIDKLRDSFKEALTALDMTLVVLIDDLDRCLPDTAVSTLEAIRLFLFLEGTAFVIAADDEMIRHAVKKHFDNPTDDQVTNYFDKLIQIPVRVPTLGTQRFGRTCSCCTSRRLICRTRTRTRSGKRSVSGCRNRGRVYESMPHSSKTWASIYRTDCLGNCRRLNG
jgi:predicted KAP-like P-loop ATPase